MAKETKRGKRDKKDKPEQEPEKSFVSETLSILIQIFSMWVLSVLIMKALRYYGIAQATVEDAES